MIVRGKKMEKLDFLEMDYKKNYWKTFSKKDTILFWIFEAAIAVFMLLIMIKASSAFTDYLVMGAGFGLIHAALLKLRKEITLEDVLLLNQQTLLDAVFEENKKKKEESDKSVGSWVVDEH